MKQEELNVLVDKKLVTQVGLVEYYTNNQTQLEKLDVNDFVKSGLLSQPTMNDFIEENGVDILVNPFIEAFSVEDLNNVFINGGNVILKSNIILNQTLTVPAGKNVMINLNGCTITNQLENTSTDVIIVEEGAKLTINGNGNITAVSGNDGYPIVCYGELIINNGVFTSGSDMNGATNACIYAKHNGKVTIYGGEFKSTDGLYVLNLHDGSRSTASITVYGGKYHNFDPSNNASEGPNTDFVAEGYESVQDGDCYVVNPVK